MTRLSRSSGGWRAWFETPGLVVLALVVTLAGLGATVVVAGAVAAGVRAGADQLVSTPAAPAHRSATVVESMDIVSGKLDGLPGSPRYTHASWSVQAGDTVVVAVTSYDDGTAPLTGAQMMYDKVLGTLGGTETVDGTPVRSVPDEDISHTFTVVGLGLNLPIPVAPKGGSVTVVARFVPERAGRFVWQCYAPCGSGPNSMGGAMSTSGWMEGVVAVRR